MAETQAQVGQEQSGPGPAETVTGGAGGDQQAHVGTAAPQLAPAAAVAALATAAPSAAAPSAAAPSGAAQSVGSAPAVVPSATAAPSAAAPSAAAPSAAAPVAAPQSPVLPPAPAGRPVTGAIHHVELWVPNLDRAIVSWGWLLTSLGYRMFQDWPGGRSWQAGDAYIVVEQSPARTASRHDRCRPGLNHMAFHVASRALVDELTAEALLHGWKMMFADDHPFAGGPQHYAAYLENSDGFEAELVAD